MKMLGNYEVFGLGRGWSVGVKGGEGGGGRSVNTCLNLQDSDDDSDGARRINQSRLRSCVFFPLLIASNQDAHSCTVHGTWLW